MTDARPLGGKQENPERPTTKALGCGGPLRASDNSLRSEVDVTSM